MDSTPSPSPAFWLGSYELTAWAEPRACHLLGAVEGPADAEFLLVELRPPGPAGERTMIVAPRYAGDRPRPAPGAPVVVNVFSAPAGATPGDTVTVQSMRLVAVGEAYATHDEAAATDAEVRRVAGGA